MTASTARLRRVADIFHRVEALDGAARARELHAACAGDAALLAEVRSLLEHAARADGFLETPALGAATPKLAATASANGHAAPPDPWIGRRLGPWRLLRRLASGGMGTVYLASRDDAQFEQRAAIKLVKRGMDSEEILRRFRRERRTLAALEHPGIARLLDGGAAPDGRPFLVMEYVDGQPIDVFCDERRLDVPARLRLFLAVCEAVRHAHGKLVVHRDLKPANILVTAEGAPKLLDFGIATVLDDPAAEGLTAEGARRLTPEYASPEQVAGEPVSTASDTYSLGVLLHELLVGRPPYRFATRTPAEIERVVLGGQPTAPSEAAITAEAARARGTSPRPLRRRLRGDLDTIVLAALRKEPERRYASVDRLASDILLHLDGRPVSARRDTFRYRTGKFLRRHALACSLAALATLALVGGAAGWAFQARLAERQRDAALGARAQSDAVTGFLQDMLAAADPAQSGPSTTLHEVLDAAASRLDVSLADRPLVQAMLHATIGRTYRAIGLYDDAAHQLREAVRLRGLEPAPRTRELAVDEADLAGVLFEQRGFDESATLLLDAIAVLDATIGHESSEVGTALSSLGAVRRAQGRLDEGEALQREALELRRRVDGPQSLAVAESLNNLSAALASQGRFADAQPLGEQALAIRRALLGERHPLVVQSTDNQAFMLLALGRLDDAEPLFRSALASEIALLGPSHPDVAVTHRNLGRLLVRAGRLPEAESEFRASLAIREQAFPPTDMRVLVTRLDLADALVAQGRPKEAQPLLDATQASLGDPAVPDELRATLRDRIAAAARAQPAGGLNSQTSK